MIKARTKFDPLTGEWLLFGITHGATMKLHMIVHGSSGALKAHYVVASPRQTGQGTHIESLKWKPQDGNLIMVVSRNGDGEPLFLEAPAAFIWHALNAYEEDGSIVADFVGYDAPTTSRRTTRCSIG